MDVRTCFLVALLTTACQPSAAPADASAAADVADAAALTADTVVAPADVPARCKSGTAVVALTTSDGVRLEADLASPGSAGGAGAILLHMIPPSNDRGNYPSAVVDALVARGVTVLNLDRRGAGNSDGVARDAYLGAGGARDVRAAYEFLRSQPCAVDATRVVLVGASNGTASIVDYTVAADGDARPAGMIFLTGGAYTEAQSRFAAHRDRLDATPILFVYSRAERAWSAGFQAGAPATWRFREYDPGAHGTGMFAPQPGVVDVIADFIVSARR